MYSCSQIFYPEKFSWHQEGQSYLYLPRMIVVHVTVWWPFLPHIRHLCLRLYRRLWRAVLSVVQLHWIPCSAQLRIVWPKWPHHPQRLLALMRVKSITICAGLIMGSRGRLLRGFLWRGLLTMCLLLTTAGVLTIGSAMGRMPILWRSSWQNWCPQGRASITGFFSRHMAHSFSELKRRSPQAGLVAYDFLHMGHLVIVFYVL